MERNVLKSFMEILTEMMNCTYFGSVGGRDIILRFSDNCTKSPHGRCLDVLLMSAHGSGTSVSFVATSTAISLEESIAQNCI